MLKILQVRLQQYMNQELDLEKAEEIANIRWIIRKARESQKSIYFFIDYTKAFDCVDHNKLRKILKEIGLLDPLSCLLSNLYCRSRSNS